jgi:hypothetical protein
LVVQACQPKDMASSLAVLEGMVEVNLPLHRDGHNQTVAVLAMVSEATRLSLPVCRTLELDMMRERHYQDEDKSKSTDHQKAWRGRGTLHFSNSGSSHPHL